MYEGLLRVGEYCNIRYFIDSLAIGADTGQKPLPGEGPEGW